MPTNTIVERFFCLVIIEALIQSTESLPVSAVINRDQDATQSGSRKRDLSQPYPYTQFDHKQGEHLEVIDNITQRFSSAGLPLKNILYQRYMKDTNYKREISSVQFPQKAIDNSPSKSSSSHLPNQANDEQLHNKTHESKADIRLLNPETKTKEISNTNISLKKDMPPRHEPTISLLDHHDRKTNEKVSSRVRRSLDDNAINEEPEGYADSSDDIYEGKAYPADAIYVPNEDVVYNEPLQTNYYSPFQPSQEGDYIPKRDTLDLSRPYDENELKEGNLLSVREMPSSSTKFPEQGSNILPPSRYNTKKPDLDNVTSPKTVYFTSVNRQEDSTVAEFKATKDNNISVDQKKALTREDIKREIKRIFHP